MTRKIRTGISTCPNDTFAFHAIIAGEVHSPEIEFDIELLDIQQLNEKLFRSQYDVGKVSFHAALYLAERMTVLPTGSALGFGVGPLLLCSGQFSKWSEPRSNSAALPSDWAETFVQQHGRKPIVLCPGETTTATLLFKMFFGSGAEINHVVFSDIMPMLQAGKAEMGVCIHEGRFTWQESQLGKVADLGELWESRTKCPLPLGGLIGKKELGNPILTAASNLIRESIQFGLANPEQTISTMRMHAQEFSDDVLMAHVDLYVNEWTVDLGEQGAASLSEFSKQALATGAVTSDARELNLFDDGYSATRVS